MTPKVKAVLELVKRDDLMDELASRFDTIIIAGLKELSPDQADHIVWYSGNPWVASGLGHAVMMEAHLQSIQERSPDEQEQTTDD